MPEPEPELTSPAGGPAAPAPSGIDWAALWRRGQEGWPSSFVLAQFPNAPLLTYLAAAAITRVGTERVHDGAWALSRVALTIWAFEEAARGVNWFRRGLGAVALVVITVGLARHLG